MGNKNSIPPPRSFLPLSSRPPAAQRRELPTPLPPPQKRESKPSEIEKKIKGEQVQDILKEADSPIDKSSTDKLYDLICSSGLFLSNKTKKFWMNNKLENCFMLYARTLSLTWGEDPRYWKWIPPQESSEPMEAVELKKVSWLEVIGKLDTRKLTGGVKYKVCFHVMLKDTAQGWEAPVTLRLVLPGGKKQENKVSLISTKKNQWIEIPVGEFVAPGHDDEAGDIEFSLYGIEGGAWKTGLVIKGVSFKPNPND